ncbi:MAG TPA: lipoprotein [Steroidobacteraceae bacterium]
MKRRAQAALMVCVIAAAMLAACGQKGQLYLPKKIKVPPTQQPQTTPPEGTPPPGTTPAPQSPSTPTPAPAPQSSPSAPTAPS